MKALLWVVGIVVVFGVLFGGGDDGDGGSGGPDDSSTSDSNESVDRAEVIGDDIGAEVICEQFVEERLKSPTTAEFDADATHVSGKVWRVVGTVDSENSFGAMIRNDYACTVQFLGDDRWRLKDLEGLTS